MGTFEEAQAYYWISIILRKKTITSRDWKSIEKDADAPLKLAIKQLNKYLRTNPRDVNALKLLVSSYRTLGRTDALYKAEIELKKAEALNTNSSFVPQINEIDKSGQAFEIKCQKLLDTMGFTTKTTTPTNDGGVDIVAIRYDPILSGKYIVQCKDWQSSVGVKPECVKHSETTLK